MWAWKKWVAFDILSLHSYENKKKKHKTDCVSTHLPSEVTRLLKTLLAWIDIKGYWV